MKEIAILDYGMGNVRSIRSALVKMGANPLLTGDSTQILQSNGLVLPGVGAFKAGMDELYKRDLCELIISFIQSGKPLLAICLGMQMLFEESDEFGQTKGLGVIPGKVVRLPFIKSGEKLPHIGWNHVEEPDPGRWEGTVMQGIKKGSEFYFVHSYCGIPKRKEDVLTETTYGTINFCSAVHHNNIYGFQYHPEKSGECGLEILKQFIKKCS